MGYAVGIDLGTTFTAAGISVAGKLETIPLGAHAVAVPSVAFVDSPMSFGDEALARGAARPDRLVREFKRDLGQDHPILVDGHALTAEQLTGNLAEWVIARCTQLQGSPPTDVVVTHPASWRSFRRERLAAALSGVARQVGNLTLATEPEAAAVYYATRDRIPDGAVIAVYDLGGGTFDAAVLRKTVTSFEPIGKPAGDATVGGSDLDQELLTFALEQAGHPLRTLDRTNPTIAAELGRLRDAVTRSKELLSIELDVAIGVRLGQPAEIRITRRDLERLAEPLLDSTLDTFNEALRNAKVTPADLHAIVLVGGGSRMPLVGQMISTTYGAPIAVDTHPKFAICLGAAILAADRAGAAQGVVPAEPGPANAPVDLPSPFAPPIAAATPIAAALPIAAAAPVSAEPALAAPVAPPTPGLGAEEAESEPAPDTPGPASLPTLVTVPGESDRSPNRAKALVAAAAVVVVLLGLLIIRTQSGGSNDEAVGASVIADSTSADATTTVATTNPVTAIPATTIPSTTTTTAATTTTVTTEPPANDPAEEGPESQTTARPAATAKATAPAPTAPSSSSSPSPLPSSSFSIVTFVTLPKFNTVPNLVGMTQAQATAAYSKLAFASTCTKFSSMLGKVVSQSPTAGTSYTLLNAPTITIYIAQFLNPVCGS